LCPSVSAAPFLGRKLTTRKSVKAAEIRGSSMTAIDEYKAAQQELVQATAALIAAFDRESRARGKFREAKQALRTEEQQMREENVLLVA
jgi:hypothetical protein